MLNQRIHKKKNEKKVKSKRHTYHNWGRRSWLAMLWIMQQSLSDVRVFEMEDWHRHQTKTWLFIIVQMINADKIWLTFATNTWLVIAAGSIPSCRSNCWTLILPPAMFIVFDKELLPPAPTMFNTLFIILLLPPMAPRRPAAALLSMLAARLCCEFPIGPLEFDIRLANELLLLKLRSLWYELSDGRCCDCLDKPIRSSSISWEVILMHSESGRHFTVAITRHGNIFFFKITQWDEDEMLYFDCSHRLNSSDQTTHRWIRIKKAIHKEH